MTMPTTGYACEEGDIGIADTPWFKSQPNGIVYLGKVAYRYKGYYNGQSVSIKQGTERIGYNCFSGQLISDIPSSVKSIGAGAFKNCRFTSFSLPANLSELGSSSFDGCEGLTDVTIPDNVKLFYASTFSGCGLSSLTIGKGVKCIFRGNHSVYINYGYNYEYEEHENNELRTHSSSYRLTNLTEIEKYYEVDLDAPEPDPWYYSSYDEAPRYGLDVQTIKVAEGNIVFDSRDNCNAVIHTKTNTLVMGSASTIIPNSITAIGWNAFKDCGISSLTIPSSVKSIDIEAFRGSKLQSIAIPSSLSEISTCAFANCVDLTSVTMDDGVTSIGECAFAYCTNLNTVSIPSSITSIGNNSFAGCNNLTSVTVGMASPVSIDYNSFPWPNATLYVPYGSKAAYEAADYWKEFKEIVEMEPVEPEHVELTDISTINNVIYIEPMEARTGTQATISLKMKNTAPIRAFQFDLYLPEGVTAVKSAKGKIQGFLSVGRLPDEDEHTLSFSEQPDGAIRFLCGSEYDETFTGNDGEIATLLVNIADNIADGDYPIQLKGMKLTETDISKYYETALVQSKLTISTYVIGDINGDGVVDVSDYTGVANHIHNNTPVGFNAKAADVDESGGIDVSDYTGIANIIHTGSIYGNNSNARMMVRGPRKVNTDLSSKDNVIYVKPLAALAGSQATISVKMKNTAEIRSFQFDLQLPDGVTVVKSAKGKIQGSLSASRLPEEDEHTLSFSEHEGNVIRFLCGSLSDETFTGNDGEIATLLVDVAANVEAEDHTVYLRNMKLSESDISKFYQTEELGTTLAVAPEGSARGDANGDKSVSVTDIAVVVNQILQIANTGGFLMYGADANGDGDITVTDIGVIVDKILGTKTSVSSRKMEQEVEPQ